MPVSREEYRTAKKLVEEYEAQENSEDRIMKRGVYTVVKAEWSKRDERGRPLIAEYDMDGQVVVKETVYSEGINSENFFSVKSIRTYLK